MAEEPSRLPPGDAFEGSSVQALPALASVALRIDRKTYSVTIACRSVRLTAAEFDILSLLVEHRDRVVSHLEIANKVFGCSTSNAAALVRVHVCHIRRALGAYGDIIATVRQRGYHIAPERVVEPPAQNANTVTTTPATSQVVLWLTCPPSNRSIPM